MPITKPAYDKLIFELSRPGRYAYSLPECDVPVADPAQFLPKEHLREKPAELPEVSEVDVIRHYSRLSQMNYGVDTHFYPLGSCTMKYNPKINEDMARLPGFARLHPLTPEGSSQGALQLMHELARDLGRDRRRQRQHHHDGHRPSINAAKCPRVVNGSLTGSEHHRSSPLCGTLGVA